MGVLSIGKLRSRRYVRCELKYNSTLGWDYNRATYNRLLGCFNRRVAFYSQPYWRQAICGSWAYTPIQCVQHKDRGLGKTYNDN